MATNVSSLPELDRKLVHERSAVVASIEALRGRLRNDLKELNPRRQIKRHPEAVLIGVGVIALLAGRLLGGLVRAIF